MDRAEGRTVRAGVLTLRHVSKRYPGAGSPAVDDLSFVVPAGQVCVLIGPSGCGKTTALKMINRLIEPTAGEILLDDTDVRTRPAAALRRDIGYVIQQVGLMPHQTIRANVATVPRLLGWPSDRIATRVNELLSLIGLDPHEYGGRYPSELSGGQQQRVGLARALAADPPLMLMDEPFSAVDPITRERLQNDFLRLHRQVPKTVVFVSHDIDEAVKMADVVAVLRDGRLVQFDTPAALLARPVDDFVADFVGSDRALKGLSLTRLEQVPQDAAPVVVDGTPLTQVRARADDGDLTPVGDAVLVVDTEGRPLRWRSLADAGTHVRGDGPPVEPVLDEVTTLRDALSALFEAGASTAVVVDAHRRVTGIVDIAAITGALRSPAEMGDDG